MKIDQQSFWTKQKRKDNLWKYGHISDEQRQVFHNRILDSKNSRKINDYIGVVNMSEEKSKPVKKFRVGGIVASVWEHKKDDVTSQSVTFQKSYKDGDEWKETNSYFPQDLPKLALVSKKAYEFVSGFKEE